MRIHTALHLLTAVLPFPVTGGSIENVAYTLTGEFTCGADWIDVTPVSATTAAGDSTGVEVSLDSTGVPLGTYTAQLCVSRR